MIEDTPDLKEYGLVGVGVGYDSLVEETWREAVTAIDNTYGVSLSGHYRALYIFSTGTSAAGLHRVDGKGDFSDVTIYKVMVNGLPLLIYPEIVDGIAYPFYLCRCPRLGLIIV